MEITSTYPEISLKIDPEYPDEVIFRVLLTAMRARASRFENVIELDPPQRVADDMLYTVRERETDPDEHVGVTGADFPKLKKLVWNGGEDLWDYTRKERVAAARFCFDKPDLEVEVWDYVWSDSDERDMYSEEEKMARTGATEMASADDDEMASSNEDKVASPDDDEMASANNDELASSDDGEDLP
jgi:hypothetical protein